MYILFTPGMLLDHVRINIACLLDKYAGKLHSIYIQKPLWGCLPCMASVWSIIFTGEINIPQMLTVCGINILIAKLLDYERSIGE